MTVVCALHTLMQFLDAELGSLVKRNLQEYLMDDRSKRVFNSQGSHSTWKNESTPGNTMEF